MCKKNVQRKIKERVVEKEAKEEEEEEEEDIDVEEEQQDTQEPHVPPGALLRKRNQFHLNALLRKRNQGKRKQTFRMMKQLQRKNLPQDFTMVKISLETRMIQFFEN